MDGYGKTLRKYTWMDWMDGFSENTKKNDGWMDGWIGGGGWMDGFGKH
jgi:hypothetical protein